MKIMAFGRTQVGRFYEDGKGRVKNCPHKKTRVIAESHVVRGYVCTAVECLECGLCRNELWHVGESKRPVTQESLS